MKWFLKQAANVDPRMFGPGEDPSLFGTPQVNIVGDVLPTVMSVDGIQGAINIDFTLKDVKAALEQTHGGQFFNDITMIKVEPMSGKFGYVDSQHPHVIHLNEEAVLSTIREAIEVEARSAESRGITPEITPEVTQKIKYEVAKKLAAILGHERAHAEDFQQELWKIITTGQGNMSSVPESHGPAAEKDVEGRFKWKG